MFFNSDLLTKRGALAQVWMASHLTSKLSKQALTSTSIPKSVQSILGQDLLPMALRLSGQLLLGIARIYSRKTKYLLDDAQETLVKVKKAFQNEGRGAVDLPDDIGGGVAGEERGGRDINLRRDGGDLEDLFAGEFADGEWNLEKHLAAAAAVKAKAAAGGAKGKQKALTANLADITLDESFTHDYSSNFGGLDNGLGDGFDDLGLDLGFGGEEGFDPDFALFEDDAELNALANPDGAAATKKRSKKRSRNGEDDGEGSERSEDDQSVEMGRDAVHHASSERGSIGPFDLDLGLGKDANGDVSMDFGAPEEYGGGFDDVGLDMGFDNNNEFGGGFDEPLPGGDREKTPTAAGSAAGDDLSSLHLTPRAAAEIAARAAQQAKDAEKAGDPAKKRQKALAVDKVIELDWEAGRLEGKERFKDPEFLPASRVHLALLAANSTSAHLPRALPKESKNALALESFAPPGLLAPELQELFKMPTRREQIKLEGRERDKAAEKEGADKDVELGRRAMSVISNVRGGSVIGDGAENPFGEFDLNQDFGGGFDEAPAGGEEYGGGFDGGEFQLDLELDAGIADEQGDVFKTPTKANRASKKQKTSHDVGSREPSIFEGEGTPAPSSLFKDDLPQYRSEGPLAVFDDVSSASTVAGSVAESQSQSQPQAATASQSLGTTEEGDAAESMVEQKTGTVSLRSKNTRKAVGVLKSELLEKENETGVETLEFGKVAEKASRRAAASFFFELLVLSSADVVKLRQPTAYGEIEVKATEKLREMVA